MNRKIKASGVKVAALNTNKSSKVALNSLYSHKWYPKIELMLQTMPKTACAIATDNGEDNKTKSYTWFQTSQEMITYVSRSKEKHFYELVLESSAACWLFFDIDRMLDPDTEYVDNSDEYKDIFIKIFITKLTSFLHLAYNIGTDLVIGENIQIADSTKPTKLSLHVRVNIMIPCIQQIKEMVKLFELFVCNTKNSTLEEIDMFYCGSRKFAIDTAVYRKGCFRMLYSSKWTKQNIPLIPYKNSSKSLEDHLILIHESPKFIIQSELSLNESFSKYIEIEYSKLQEPCYSLDWRPVIQNSATNNIPEEHLNQVATMLEKEMNVTFRYNRFHKPNVFDFVIDKQCRHVCLYAERQHTNNRSYIRYYYDTQSVVYKCFNEKCIEKSKVFPLKKKIKTYLDHISRLNDLNISNTLHCKNNMIIWSEDYSSETMDDYPLERLVAIKANMGVGKTAKLAHHFVKKYCDHKNTKCLFITYSRILAKKYTAMLEPYGFVSYLDIETKDIEHSKVIVCLDSLTRVVTSDFKFIFVDEVLSVLLHFNSSLMQKTSMISTFFERFLLQAQFVYVLDACVDNAMVYNFMTYLSIKRKNNIYWIRNTYVRPSNRNVYLNYNDCGAKHKALVIYAMREVLSGLRLQQKLVVCSSSKSFTMELKAEIEREMPDKKILVYNSDTDKQILSEHALNPDIPWSSHDIVIYSPTITSGFSFELPYFDNLVAYVENSFMTPTVDLVLQQMFRVRQLNNGNMHIYCNDCIDVDHTDYPSTEAEIKSWLDDHIQVLHNYFPQDALSFESSMIVNSKGDIKYDKDRLSYNILVGILYNKNKSIKYFKDILIATLKDDYDIPVTVRKFDLTRDELVKVMALYNEIKKERDCSSTIHVDLEKSIISNEEYEHLKKKAAKSECLSDQELLKKWIYEAANELWCIDINKLDQHFFHNYIGIPEKKNIDDVYRSFYKAQRFKDMMNDNILHHQHKMKQRLQSIFNDHDPNLKLYQTQLNAYYEKLIDGHKLLNCIFDECEFHEKMVTNGKIEIDQNTYWQSLKIFFNEIQDDHVLEMMLKRFKIKKREYKTLKEFRANVKDCQSVAETILKSTFGFSIKVERESSNSKRKGYENVNYTFSSHWLELANKYNIQSLKLDVRGYQIEE